MMANLNNAVRQFDGSWRPSAVHLHQSNDNDDAKGGNSNKERHVDLPHFLLTEPLGPAVSTINNKKGPNCRKRVISTAGDRMRATHSHWKIQPKSRKKAAVMPDIMDGVWLSLAQYWGNRRTLSPAIRPEARATAIHTNIGIATNYAFRWHCQNGRWENLLVTYQSGEPC